MYANKLPNITIFHGFKHLLAELCARILPTVYAKLRAHDQLQLSRWGSLGRPWGVIGAPGAVLGRSLGFLGSHGRGPPEGRVGSLGCLEGSWGGHGESLGQRKPLLGKNVVIPYVFR